MNGKDVAEQFNTELDGLFAGGRGKTSVSDPAAMELAGKLARADFSADSKIRETLRARLVAGQPAPAAVAEEEVSPFRLYFKTLFPVALAAACVLLVIVPVMRKNGTTPPAAPSTAPQTRPSVTVVEVKSETPRAARRAAVPAAAAEPAGEESLFHSIPMAGLGGGHKQDFPIESRKEGFPITVQEGHKTDVPGGADIVWETEGAVFILERRVISVDDVFERRSL